MQKNITSYRDIIYMQYYDLNYQNTKKYIALTEISTSMT